MKARRNTHLLGDSRAGDCVSKKKMLIIRMGAYAYQRPGIEVYVIQLTIGC